MQQKVVDKVCVIDELIEIIKSDLRTYINERIIGLCPEDRSSVTKKIYREAFVYTQGYAEALKEHIILPINKHEMQVFLFERAFDYIIREISRSKKR